MRIGILTYHRSHNYGAYLQAYSLSNALNKEEGITCEIINYNLQREDTIYKKRRYKRPMYYYTFLKQDKMFEKMQSKQLLSECFILDDEYEEVLRFAEENYDVVIAGSDEIWRIATRGFPNVYWMPGKYKFVKMSYAASGRMLLDNLSEQQKSKLGELYRDFSYIGVRDEATKKLVEGVCSNKQVYRNCDPAFLYDGFKSKKKLKHEICSKWNINEKKKLIAIMYDRTDIISKMRRKLGKEYEFICITRPMWNADKNLCAVNPFEWIDIIGGCDYLISSYFHGMLFAVNQNTPFIVIDRRVNKDNMETSKLYDFLHFTNMENRYCLSIELDDKKWDCLAQQIMSDINEGKTDFSSVVDRQRAMYKEFLEQLRKIGK